MVDCQIVCRPENVLPDSKSHITYVRDHKRTWIWSWRHVGLELVGAVSQGMSFIDGFIVENGLTLKSLSVDSAPNGNSKMNLTKFSSYRKAVWWSILGRAISGKIGHFKSFSYHKKKEKRETKRNWKHAAGIVKLF